MNTRQQDVRGARTDQLALGLGWFSIALGVAEMAAPRPLARLVGAPDTVETEQLLRALGTREIANGLAILTEPEKARWLYTRAAGGAMDLSLIGAAFTTNNCNGSRLCAASAAVAGLAALDLLGALALRRRAVRANGAARDVRVEEVVTINRSIDEVYAFWRAFENLPRFMRHLVSVEETGGTRSRWRARGPAGTTVEWEAEVLHDRPNERLVWRSLEGADIENSGSVTFRRAPGARGTEVRVALEYRAPAGNVGRAVASLLGEEPKQQIRDDLRRFKQIMETGEVAASDSSGLGRAARPPAHARKRQLHAGAPQ